MHKSCIAFVVASFFAFGAATTAFAQSALSGPPLSEAQWNGAETDNVAFLMNSPGECLAPAKKPGAAYEIELGRAAFSSPFLFGGTAARSGLSCNSCHRDGRDNPDFFLSGLSSDPGTADVTSSIFSKAREDNLFNPVPIPTLVDIVGKESFGETAPQPSIEAFVTGAVHEEFQGAASPDIIAGIAAYVAHLNEGFCPEGKIPQSVTRALDDVKRSLAAAQEAIERGDHGAVDLLLQSARHGLGLVHERYRGDRLATERALIADLSRQLAALRPSGEGDPALLAVRMAPVLDQLGLIERRLQRKERHSLYNEKQLRRLYGEKTSLAPVGE